jgi:hypothetical protein
LKPGGSLRTGLTPLVVALLVAFGALLLCLGVAFLWRYGIIPMV